MGSILPWTPLRSLPGRGQQRGEIIYFIFRAMINYLLLKGVVVSVYLSRPAFLIEYPHTFNVFRLEVSID